MNALSFHETLLAFAKAQAARKGQTGRQQEKDIFHISDNLI